MKPYLPLLFACILILSFSCSNEKVEKKRDGRFIIPDKSTVIADTITVDVTLRAMDTTSIWDVEQHKYINQRLLVDYIFDGIYNEKFSAFDFFTGEELSKFDVEKVEKEEGFNRDKVTKIQFKEFWYIDSTGVLQKQILSYTLGLEKTSEKGTPLGHKALFTVNPN
ncbi:MAG TPA: hypothetical protein PL017_12390 [Tenuifilaceae bacterium]|nr:hypothetical protein [Tenuifilaceae bacterium]HPE17598.1 hypothetical protein [Tenuifilaceae bacterium]HPJ46888.1 hypothetical protein [Tenuifilaceae bacterium]HPQ33754.1 hypothetical protein [Tenuifilaceae bacterium]HRX69156.1 hypothetical protein [Tenuifilaceae bacterium]